MKKVWTPPLRLVFGAATVLGFFSALEAYRLTTLNMKGGAEIEAGRLLLLNLAYWYVPAAFTPVIFWISERFRLDGRHWVRGVMAHVGAAAVFSVVHIICMIGMRSLLWPGMREPASVPWTNSLQQQYLKNLDWTLMTYAAIAGLSYALGYQRESQE